MEYSEELEWELYDIFISGIFAFPIYEHNAARRIVRYLLMRGVLDEEIASAIEGPTVDLRIWLNRGGKQLVGEWVIAWLNDSRDQYKNRRRTAGSRGRSQLQGRGIFFSERDDDAHEGSPFSVQSYLTSSVTHRSSLSSESNDSRWTKEDESDISSDFDLEEEQEDREGQMDVEEDDDRHSVQRRSSVEVEDDEPRKLRGQQLEIRVETNSVPRYKIHRPHTLTLDPDALSLLPCPRGSWVIDAPDSGHVSDAPCSCLDPSSAVDYNGDTYDQQSPQEVHGTEGFTAAPLPTYCSDCHCTLPHYLKIFSDARQMMCAGCRNDAVVTGTAAGISDNDLRCQEVATA